MVRGRKKTVPAPALIVLTFGTSATIVTLPPAVVMLAPRLVWLMPSKVVAPPDVIVSAFATNVLFTSSKNVLPAPSACTVTLPAERNAVPTVPLLFNTILPPVDVTMTLPPPTTPLGWPMREPATVPALSVILPSAVTVTVPVCGVAELLLGPSAEPALASAPPFNVTAPCTIRPRLVTASVRPPMREPPEPAPAVLPVRVKLPLTVMFWFGD